MTQPTVASVVGQKIAGYFSAPAVGGPPIAQAAGTPQTPSGYQLLDIRRTPAIGAAPAPASGIITATFPEVDPSQLWLVERMTVYCTSNTDTIALVYVGQASPQNIAEGTEAGNLDFGEGTPILVPGSQPLTVEWTGASIGATAIVVAQYRVMG